MIVEKGLYGEYNILCFKVERSFKTRNITHVTAYILKHVYRMVWRCGGTYSWIHWRTKEMDISDFFLSI